MKRTYHYDARRGKVVALTPVAPVQAPRVLTMRPFVTEQITGQPIEIRTARQKARLLKAHGLIEQPTYRDTRPPDPRRPYDVRGAVTRAYARAYALERT